MSNFASLNASLKIIILMWQYGIVDTFTAVNFIYNAGTQYGAIVIGAIADGNATSLPRMLLEPIAGFGVSYQFIKAAQTTAERQARVATLATFLSASAGAATGSNPATNAGIGAGIAAHIAHMRCILEARGGHGGQFLGSEVNKTVLNSVKNPVFEINQHTTQFTYNSKVIIDNMFQEHATRRYIQRSIQKFKTVTPASLVPIASTPINSTALISWTCFSVGLISFMTLGMLYLFQCAEPKRWEIEKDPFVIRKYK